jgi:phytoene dehydrogenase-like protein
MTQEVTIVGGGIAGLVTAIHLGEAGGHATLHEAGARLGGRGRSDQGDYRTNLGPHALYRHGEFERWLIERKLLPCVRYPSLTGLRLRVGGRLRRLPLALLPVMRSLGKSAPVDECYRDWASRELGSDAAEAAIGLAALPTFHADPGTLSAAFVQERLQRSGAWRPVYYIDGGWSKLVERLEQRARELGVTIRTGSKLAELPQGPVVVATDLPMAARLLEDDSIAWPGAKTALLDVAWRSARGEPAAVLDLDERIYASRYSAGDAGLAPEGESLIQAMAGVRSDETTDSARARIESVLDDAYPGWRDRITWQRKGLVDGGAGPADPPGTSWRDRPAIDRGAGRWLVGDRVAAPGVLSEVSFASARIAAGSLIEKLGD